MALRRDLTDSELRNHRERQRASDRDDCKPRPDGTAAAARRRSTSVDEMNDDLTAPLDGATHVTFGPVEIDFAPVGDARIKRLIYPAGMRWSTDIKPLAKTDTCEHAHAGFLVQGGIRFEFPDGCVLDFNAPAFVDVAPGHDALITGDVDAVLIETDFERDTISRLGVDAEHRH